jgi:hypothetical protein
MCWLPSSPSLRTWLSAKVKLADPWTIQATKARYNASHLRLGKHIADHVSCMMACVNLTDSFSIAVENDHNHLTHSFTYENALSRNWDRGSPSFGIWCVAPLLIYSISGIISGSSLPPLAQDNCIATINANKINPTSKVLFHHCRTEHQPAIPNFWMLGISKVHAMAWYGSWSTSRCVSLPSPSCTPVRQHCAVILSWHGTKVLAGRSGVMSATQGAWHHWWRYWLAQTAPCWLQRCIDVQ